MHVENKKAFLITILIMILSSLLLYELNDSSAVNCIASFIVGLIFLVTLTVKNKELPHERDE